MPTNPYIDSRCTHTTAHGNRCRMFRMDDKTSLCQMHFDQRRRLEEDDLAAGQLLSPIEDLKTPAQINDALRRLFQLLARQRIPPRNAAILAYICQLLLTSLSAMERQSLRAEMAPAVKKILARFLIDSVLDAAPESAALPREEQDAPAASPQTEHVSSVPEAPAEQGAPSPSSAGTEKKPAPATYRMSYWENPKLYNYWKAGLPIEPAEPTEDDPQESRSSAHPTARPTARPTDGSALREGKDGTQTDSS